MQLIVRKKYLDELIGMTNVLLIDEVQLCPQFELQKRQTTDGKALSTGQCRGEI